TASPRDTDDLPGPLRQPEPAQARRLDHRHPAQDPRRREVAASSARARAARDGGPLTGALQPVPARVLGWAAPADRGRPGARPEPEAGRGRRTGLGARRLDPVPDAEPPGRSPEGAQADLHLHRPRSRRRSARERPHRRDVSPQARGTLAGRGSLPPADPSLLRGPSLRGADPRSGSERAEGADRPPGRRAEPDQSPVRLPLPSPVPLYDGHLQGRRAAAGGLRPGAPGGLPPSPERRPGDARAGESLRPPDAGGRRRFGQATGFLGPFGSRSGPLARIPPSR